MKRNAYKAMAALQKIGAPVINHCVSGESLDDQWGAHFILSAENRDGLGSLFADYLAEEIPEYRGLGNEIINAFGIRQDVIDILKCHGLCAEWIDPGTVGIYDC